MKLESQPKILSQENTESHENKLNEKLINYLEKNEIITYGPDHEIVCDLERLKNLSDEEMDQLRTRTVHQSNLNWQTALFEIFQDKDIYSSVDFRRKMEAEDIKPKPLFYAPSKEEAFDIDSIKKSQWYLAPSEIFGKWKTINKYYQNNLEYSGEEADVALRIYHPDFGNGQRDKNGVLMVKDKTDPEKYSAISSNWLNNNLPKQTTRKTNGRNRMRLWQEPKTTILREEFENLYSSGLLTPDDFKHYENTDTGKTFRAETGIAKKGQIRANTVYMDGETMKSINCGYILGVEFEGKKLIKLENNLYGIVNETAKEKEITHIFRPADYETIRERYDEFEHKNGKKAESYNITIGKKAMERMPGVGVKEFHETEFMQPKRPDESEIDYANRMTEFNAVRNYNRLEKLSSRLSEEADIGIHNLTIREQNCLTTYAFQKGDKNFDRLISFCKEYGETGIKAFLSCEYGTDMGDKIVALGETLRQEIAGKIFAKYNEVATLAQQEADQLVADMTDKEITEEEKLSIKEHLLRKGKELLNDFYLLVKKKSPDQLLTRLEQIKTDIILFAATFKSLAKRGEIELKEINGTELETKPAIELSPAEKDEMMGIFLGNRVSGYSEKRLATWTSEFSEAIESKDATFYIVSTAGKIVSFIRSQPIENDKIYIGSLNVRPEAKSSQIGTAMMKEVIDKLAENNIVTCLINAKKKDLLEFFRQKLKFKTTEIKDNYKGSGEMYLHLERNDLNAMKQSPDLLVA